MRNDIDDNGVAIAAAFGDAVTPKVKKKPRAKYPRITLRVSAEEDAKLRDLAKGQPVSAYVRSCIFGENTVRRKHRAHTPVADQEALARALALLGQSRIANNLNQLAYNANTGSLLIDEGTLEQIEETYVHVVAMRDSLIAALGMADSGGKNR
jgi:hypothetical protein